MHTTTFDELDDLAERVGTAEKLFIRRSTRTRQDWRRKENRTRPNLSCPSEIYKHNHAAETKGRASLTPARLQLTVLAALLHTPDLIVVPYIKQEYVPDRRLHRVPRRQSSSDN